MPASFQPISHLRSYLKIEPSTLLLLCFKAILEVKLAGSCIGELGPQRMNAESVSPSPNSISTYVLPLSFMLTEAVQIAPPSRSSLCLSLKYINEKAHMQPGDKCRGVYVWPMSGVCITQCSPICLGVKEYMRYQEGLVRTILGLKWYFHYLAWMLSFYF